MFFPGESHGQRSLAGHSPEGHKESDMTAHPMHEVTRWVLDQYDRYLYKDMDAIIRERGPCEDAKRTRLSTTKEGGKFH